jgi:hypothetical protein
MPSFQRLYDNYKDKVHFVFIVNEDFDVIEEFLNKKNYSFPCFRLTGTIPEMFKNRIIPTTYLIYDEHVVIYKTGAARWDSSKFLWLLDKIITT